ncbi:MAG: sarcosine oxidase subunit alpha family protein [Burkholderiaceae bacterium]
MSSHRLATGGIVDRTQPLRFSFDGQTFTGLAGDTLASALLANGRHLVARSFKYHRPRGILAAGAAEPNALVTLGSGDTGIPNTRATQVALTDGLIAHSQNRWPSLRFDLGALNALGGALLSAGFYYKSFMWPAAFWERVYEPLIRRAAGLGRAAYGADDLLRRKRWAFADLLVIGAGPAGLMAAVAAARAGVRVILVDEGTLAGGSLLDESALIDDQPAAAFAARLLAELQASPRVRVLTRATAFGAYDDQVIGVLQSTGSAGAASATAPGSACYELLWRIHAPRIILATGAEQRPWVFDGNDRPGIMLGDAMRSYVNRFAVRPGRAVAVATHDAHGYRLVHDLAEQGVAIAAVLDSRTANLAHADAERLRVHWRGRRDLPPLFSGVHGLKAHGGLHLHALTFAHETGHGRLALDALAMAGGHTPVVHLACQRGRAPVWSPTVNGFLAPAQPGWWYAGSIAGCATLAQCLADGIAAACAALRDAGIDDGLAAMAMPRIDDPMAAGWSAHLQPATLPRGKAFIDFQNDVCVRDLDLAVREGYDHVELSKRYTTTGMATDQGKTANMNAIAWLARLRDSTEAQVGTTTYRPFYTPVSFGALAGEHRGRHFRPERRSPLHAWAQRHGARFVEVGDWHRSSWFARGQENHWRTAVDREVRTVRGAVGVCDVSTLGKIELFGADAGTFLDRVYCSRFDNLAVGRARYGLMLREDGFIMDDGTTSRLGEQHYFMTTTTGAAGAVLTHLEYCHQVLWPELDVHLASVTDQWAQIAVAGPRARALLARLTDEDLSDAAMPFLAAREIMLHGGIRARLFRISFSGELAYELAVGANHGDAVAEWLIRAGAPLGVCAYGTEALAVLRIEKGFVTHAEIDGRVVPDDLGMGRMASKAREFIGRAMLARSALQASGRPQLVGLMPQDRHSRLPAGAHLLNPGSPATMADDQGHVSSACYSPTLGHPVALGLLRDGRARHGQSVRVWDGLRGLDVLATVCDPVFVDPGRERLMPADDLAMVDQAAHRNATSGQVAADRATTDRATTDRATTDRARTDQATTDQAGAGQPLASGGTSASHDAPDRSLRIARLADTAIVLLLHAEHIDAGTLAGLLGDRAGHHALRRVAPGQTLLVAPGGDADSLASALAGSPQATAYWLGQTHGRVLISVSGPAASEALAHGIGIDPCPQAFPPGRSEQTRFGHIGVNLARVGPESLN